MIGIVAEREALQSLEAAAEQRCTGEHDQRERYLRRDERVPDAAPCTRLRAGASVVTEWRRELAARRKHRWENGEDEHRGQCDADSQR